MSCFRIVWGIMNHPSHEHIYETCSNETRWNSRFLDRVEPTWANIAWPNFAISLMVLYWLREEWASSTQTRDYCDRSYTLAPARTRFIWVALNISFVISCNVAHLYLHPYLHHLKRFTFHFPRIFHWNCCRHIAVHSKVRWHKEDISGSESGPSARPAVCVLIIDVAHQRSKITKDRLSAEGPQFQSVSASVYQKNNGASLWQRYTCTFRRMCFM